MNDLPQLQIPKQGERLFALGNSGTGKTTLVKSLFKAIKHGIAIDTKHDEDWNDAGIVVEGNDIYSIGEGRYVWRAPESFPFDQDEQNKFFLWCLDVGNRTIYIDEFGDVTFSANQYPRALRMCVMRGRSRRLSIWGTTQEPIRVPSFLFGQAQHRYIFHLGHPEQRKLAADYFESPIPWDKIPVLYDEQGNSQGSPFMYRNPQGLIFGPRHLEVQPTRIERKVS